MWTSMVFEPTGSASSSQTCTAMVCRLTAAGARRSSSSSSAVSIVVRASRSPPRVAIRVVGS